MLLEEVFTYIILFIMVKTCMFLIRKIRGNLLFDVLRNLLFFVPFILPSLYLGLPNLNFQGSIDYYLLAIFSSFLALSTKYKEFKPYFNKNFYHILPKISFKDFLIMEISLIGSAVFEEFFYRTYAPASSFIVGMVLSGILFSIAHYIQNYTRSFFDLKTYILLFLLGIIWYWSYKNTGTLVPAILGHLVYNLPSMIFTYFHYKSSKIWVKKKGDYSIE
ncbi:CPBP family intramembrane glutamic endopeptidase [Bacillus nakamurai]|uniref:CPBP family intramembrane glutamic endopeptidase n=1 Tax=Bacillus nakamurai TaxID=1793963 RepID=UPI001E3F88B5|nr:CPBP family intramembrane glutamic endopeptidase [Bacillus nakamurai]MCC9022360.1 CPBP family intramembrane metalloprotease [Bacillus nakamurai]